MGRIDPEFLRFSKRIMRHARSVEERTDQLVEVAFLLIARSVIWHNPIWSGQSTLNWTAAISRTVPPPRFVNVPRSNVKARQGRKVDIVVDTQVAMTANVVAYAAVKEVARGYKHPRKPSEALPRPMDVMQRASAIRPPALYLSNSIDYVPKLWSGTWPSNPRTLRGELSAAERVLRSAKLLAR